MAKKISIRKWGKLAHLDAISAQAAKTISQMEARASPKAISQMEARASPK